MAQSPRDFKAIHNPNLSNIPDLFEWVRKQPPQFQAQLSTMPLVEFEKTFGTYCAHCMIDKKCMTLRVGVPSAVTKGICIQCQYYIKTGKAGHAQKV